MKTLIILMIFWLIILNFLIIMKCLDKMLLTKFLDHPFYVRVKIMETIIIKIQIHNIDNNL